MIAFPLLRDIGRRRPYPAFFRRFGVVDAAGSAAAASALSDRRIREAAPPFDGREQPSLAWVCSWLLSWVLAELSETLRSRGVLFCSNPRGNNEEGLSGDRYSCFFEHDTWRDYVIAAGFFKVRHYYRPPGLPRHKQWWLSTVWRKG